MVFIFIAILVFSAQYFMHWQIWSVALISYVVAGILGRTAWGVFFSAFFSVFLVWSGMAFWQDIQNDQILSSRIATMLGIANTSEWLFVITGLLGGIVGSISAIAGYYVKRIFIKARPKTPISGR